MDNRSIGVFDSGLGGLTAVKEIMRLLPDENIVYFGDTSRVPYGTRSKETILKYTHSDINFLLSRDVKMIVIACGTASSAALPEINREFEVPIFGVVEAGAKRAAYATRNNRVGIIGTPATIKSGAYAKYINEYNSQVQVFENACPLFVPLVENGHFNTEVTRLVVDEYLHDIRDAGVDTLILGCTHYPLLAEAIADYMGEGVTLISPGEEVAKQIKAVMTPETAHDTTAETDRYSYFVSDSVDNFEELGSIFLETKIDGKVSKIDIEKY